MRVIGLVWFLLSLPKPAQPVGAAVVVVLIALGLWRKRREDRALGRLPDEHEDAH